MVVANRAGHRTDGVSHCSLVRLLIRVGSNDNNVVVEQPFGKHFGERMFDFYYADPSDRLAPSSSSALGVRIDRSIACHSVNDTG